MVAPLHTPQRTKNRQEPKIYQLSGFGLEISQRIPIQMPATPHDLSYLRTKQERMGHMLNVK